MIQKDVKGRVEKIKATTDAAFAKAIAAFS
jgi:hypothetical protein